jgi:uroporphyrinogen-III synthase
VLVTRPEPEAAGTAARLVALGYRAVVSPVLKPAVLAAAKPSLDGVGALAFTSPRAVVAFAAAAAAQALPVFAVGARTAEAARAAGYSDVRQAGGDGAALAHAIRSAHVPGAGAILHPQGQETAFDLAAALRPAGIDVRPYLVYALDEAGALTPDAMAALAGPATPAVLLMSPRTARTASRLAGLSPDLQTRWRCAVKLALSPAVAQALGRDPGALAVAHRPDEASLLAALEAVFPPR